MRTNSISGTPKVPLSLYLSMVENLRSLKRFALVNQQVKDGFVFFNDVAGIKRLQELLHYHNTGEKPSEMTIKGNKLVNDSKYDLNISKHKDMLMSVRGPDGRGWYKSRCPVCEHKGGDTEHDHFGFTEEGPFHCLAGCEPRDVIEWFKAMLNDREPNFDRTKGTPENIKEFFKEEQV